MSRKLLPLLLVALLLIAPLAQTASACPFCAAVSQTFSEEIETMDAAVIAKLVQPPPPVEKGKTPSFNDDPPKAKFEIIQTLKGEALTKQTKIVETIYFGDGKIGKNFLIMGVKGKTIMWSTPLLVSDGARKYLTEIIKLPQDGPKRLVYFQNFLEADDEMLARDAYDEFAKAPYEIVKGLKPQMKHDKIIEWIQNPDIPASRRRLYLTMLGVCGTADDLPMLEAMLKSSDRKKKAGLDAMIACYLTLKGSAGMPLIEELFLKNKKAEYADTYAAIMALRFHGTETDVVPQKRLLAGLHYMLERPQLADLVIPDLARWEDWSQMDRLVKLFKEADEKTSWVRVPVINYLRACPLPKAKVRLAELEKIDPAAVKRANTFFPFGVTPSSDTKGKASSTEKKEAKSSVVSTTATKSPKKAAVKKASSAKEPKKKAAAGSALVGLAAKMNLLSLLGVLLLLSSVLLIGQWKGGQWKRGQWKGLRTIRHAST